MATGSALASQSTSPTAWNLGRSTGGMPSGGGPPDTMSLGSTSCARPGGVEPASSGASSRLSTTPTARASTTTTVSVLRREALTVTAPQDASEPLDQELLVQLAGDHLGDRAVGRDEHGGGHAAP